MVIVMVARRRKREMRRGVMGVVNFIVVVFSSSSLLRFFSRSQKEVRRAQVMLGLREGTPEVNWRAVRSSMLDSRAWFGLSRSRMGFASLLCGLCPSSGLSVESMLLVFLEFACCGDRIPVPPRRKKGFVESTYVC